MIFDMVGVRGSSPLAGTKHNPRRKPGVMAFVADGPARVDPQFDPVVGHWESLNLPGNLGVFSHSLTFSNATQRPCGRR